MLTWLVIGLLFSGLAYAWSHRQRDPIRPPRQPRPDWQAPDVDVTRSLPICIGRARIGNPITLDYKLSETVEYRGGYQAPFGTIPDATTAWGWVGRGWTVLGWCVAGGGHVDYVLRYDVGSEQRYGDGAFMGPITEVAIDPGVGSRYQDLFNTNILLNAVFRRVFQNYTIYTGPEIPPWKTQGEFGNWTNGDLYRQCVLLSPGRPGIPGIGSLYDQDQLDDVAGIARWGSWWIANRADVQRADYPIDYVGMVTTLHLGEWSEYPDPPTLEIFCRPCGPYSLTPWNTADELVTCTSTSPATVFDYGINPAHILYAALRNPEWGLGYASTAVDETTFGAAADTFLAEGLGLSICRTFGSVSDLIEEIERTADCVLWYDSTVSKWKLTAIRAAASSETLDETHVSRVVQYSRPTLEESANEVVVTFYDSARGTSGNRVYRDPISIAQRGGTIVQRRVDLPAVMSELVASRIALRELRVSVARLAALKIECDRTAAALVPGQVFTFSWSAFGIVSEDYRVVHVDLGELAAGTVIIEAVQDLFALPDAVHEDEYDPWDGDPSTVPTEPTTYAITEQPYHIVWTAQGMAQRDLVEALYDATGAAPGWAAVAAMPPSADTSALTVVATGAALGPAWRVVGVGPLSPMAVIDTGGDAIAQDETSLAYSTAANLAGIQEALSRRSELLALLTWGTDSRDSEWVLVTAWDQDTGTITVSRGVLDTTPQLIPAMATVILWAVDMGSGTYQDGQVAVAEPLHPGETYTMRLLSHTMSGRLDIADASSITVDYLDSRLFRPYAPGDTQVNGVEFPVTVTGDLVLTWAHRNKATQYDSGAEITEQGDASIKAPTDLEYVVMVYDDTTVPATLIHTSAPISDLVDTYTYTNAQEIIDNGSLVSHLIIEVWSQQKLACWQPQTRYLSRDGTWGFGWGINWGGEIT